MTDPIERIKNVDGVRYVTEHGGYYRVVFDNDADSAAVMQVERFTECSGRMSATQEHLPCIEYPIDDVDND